MFQARRDFTVLGRMNTTGEGITGADRFQAFPFKVTKEQSRVSVTAMYGLQGSDVFLYVLICACASRYLCYYCLSSVSRLTQTFTNVCIIS
jgi:hypothetical protein